MLRRFIFHSVVIHCVGVQTIDFDDFQIWEGKCSPMDEPMDQELTHPTPMWPNMKTDLNKPTTLLALIAFEKAFVGGGCGDFEIENRADVPCEDYELELNIRPDWGALLLKEGKPNLSGLTMIDSDPEAGMHGHLSIMQYLHSNMPQEHA